MVKGGTISPVLRTLEQKLKLGLYSPTDKSITKTEAIQVLTSHLIITNPVMSSNTGFSNFRTKRRGRVVNTRKKAKQVATEIINNMYQRLKKHNPAPFRIAKPKPRRFRSATRRSKSPRYSSTRRRKRRRTA